MCRIHRIAVSTIAGLSFALPSCGSARIAVEAVSDAAPQPVLAGQPAKESPGSDKPIYPADRGGAMLTDLLAPTAKGRARMDMTTAPRRPRADEWPEPANVPSQATAPLPHAALEKPLAPRRPVDLPEALPFFDQLAAQHLPEVRHLPVGARPREASPDVNLPIPLPILAQQVQDRAALDDPTVDASLAIALALSPPLRSIPAPFVPLVLPHPFPHRETVRLRQPPAEDSTPVTAAPKPPSKP